MPQPTKVADLEDLPPGKSACVDFAGESVALFNVNGSVHVSASAPLLPSTR